MERRTGMSALSMSFTLGKVSTGSANLEHNNREFFADNVDVTRIKDNVIYANQDVREAYDELFGDALKAYNAKQKQPCRRIHDYYEHIFEGSREEAFYELVVQFGDMKTAGVGSENGEIAKKMLDDYMRGFKERNKNLHIFSGNLHMDEASPHLHIVFIPFYTEGRKNGLLKGVSMKAALIEQGFKPKSQTQNQLYLWQEGEKAVMEELLHRYNFKRDIKDADYAHQSVPDYKESQDAKRLRELMQIGVPRNEINAENVDRLKRENSLLEIEKEKATARERSPWKSFYYSEPDKQEYVQATLSQLQIPFRETDNGFEAQDCYVAEIRKIEKQFKAPMTSHRNVLRDKIDMLVLQSENFTEFLQRLNEAEYKVKLGKYISVLPKDSNQHIRLKSLGEYYSEDAIRNRIMGKKLYINEIDRKIDTLSHTHAPDSLEIIVQKTIKHYTVVFVQGVLPMRKINNKKPFRWENDAELDRLSELNKKITAGATLSSLRKDFIGLEYNISRFEQELKPFEDSTLASRLYQIGYNHFNYRPASNDDLRLLIKHGIDIDRNDTRLPSETLKDSMFVSYKYASERVEQMKSEIEQSLSESREKLKDTSETLSLLEKVVSGTYNYSLVTNESNRRQSDYINNGLKSANASSLESEHMEKAAWKVIQEQKAKQSEPEPTKPVYTGRKK
jgi:hypothetical protein